MEVQTCVAVEDGQKLLTELPIDLGELQVPMRLTRAHSSDVFDRLVIADHVVDDVAELFGLSAIIIKTVISPLTSWKLEEHEGLAGRSFRSARHVVLLTVTVEVRVVTRSDEYRVRMGLMPRRFSQ